MKSTGCLAFCLLFASVGSGFGLAQTEAETERSTITPPTGRVHELQVNKGKSGRIADVLAGLIEGVKLTAVGDRLIFSVRDDVPRQVDADIRHLVLVLDNVLKVPKPPSTDPNAGLWARVERVYHVDAATVATALDQSIEGVKVKPVGADRLVVFAEGASQGRKVREMRRRIALLDLPQPKMSLQMWAFQMSDKDAVNVQKASVLLRQITYDFDQQISAAFDRAWDHIVGLFATHAAEKSIFDQALYDYLTSSDRCIENQSYCLGYLVGENAYPSMAKMLVALALTREPEGHIEALLCAMELSSAASRDSIYGCRSRKPSTEPEVRVGLGAAPSFPRFRRALDRLYGRTRRYLLQAAVADFLFSYKWSVEHSNDFSPYGFSRSADQLNSLFSPVFEAFMRDLEVYVDQLEQHPRWVEITTKLPEKKRLNTGLRIRASFGWRP